MVIPMAAAKSPQVSIILPAYNRAVFLRRAIESVFRQTFEDWELIVIDDASTDETPAVLAEYVERDKRVRVIRNQENQYGKVGLPGNLNQGLAVARANYIARLDDDDYWIDEKKLAKQVAFLDAHPDCAVVGGGMVIVDEQGKERSRYLKKETDGAIRKGALFANPFSHTTVMFRADIARKAGSYRAHYAEDWDLWLSMGIYGTFYNFQEYFTAYSQSEASYSFIYQRKQSKVVLGFLRKHRKEYPNFFVAYALNLFQYWYSFLPFFARRRLHSFLSVVKRRSF